MPNQHHHMDPHFHWSLSCILAGLLFFSPLYGLDKQAEWHLIPPSGQLVRERQNVTVESRAEEWRLEWRTPPQFACDPSSEDWYTCPCDGFAFGETGELDLVRQRSGMPEERLALSPYFSTYNDDNQAKAQLQRWPVREGDFDRMSQPGFAKLVKSRPIVKIMNLADYDHDGRATEFLLQIGAGPCGHRQTVLVGISRINPKLHVFGTLVHPEAPLVLESPNSWKQLLLSKGKTTIITWLCGDHGAEEEIDMELNAGINGIRAYQLLYECGPGGKGKLLERTER
jgi:hypothetical protein